MPPKYCYILSVFWMKRSFHRAHQTNTHAHHAPATRPHTKAPPSASPPPPLHMEIFFLGCIWSLPDWKDLKIAHLAYSHAKLWPQGIIFTLFGCFDVMSDGFKVIFGSQKQQKSDFFFVCRSGKFSTWCVTLQKKLFHIHPPTHTHLPIRHPHPFSYRST